MIYCDVLIKSDYYYYYYYLKKLLLLLLLLIKRLLPNVHFQSTLYDNSLFEEKQILRCIPAQVNKNDQQQSFIKYTQTNLSLRGHFPRLI